MAAPFPEAQLEPLIYMSPGALHSYRRLPALYNRTKEVWETAEVTG